jgi:tripartite-type tricarboxylate transporter receptor subunit TctC
MITDPGVVKPFVQAGKLRILGITSKQHLSTYPDVAPLAESGLPGYDYASWVGVFAPAGAPPDALRKINQAFAKALAEPATEKFLTDLGMIAVSTSQDQFQAFLREQLGMWGRLTKEAGLTPQ